jgi:hypothetical protein
MIVPARKGRVINMPLVLKARKRKWMTPSQTRFEMFREAAEPGLHAA